MNNEIRIRLLSVSPMWSKKRQKVEVIMMEADAGGSRTTTGTGITG